MNANDLRQLSKEELQRKVAELRGEERDLRFTVKNRQQSKVRNLRKIRKTLARVLTLLSEQK